MNILYSAFRHRLTYYVTLTHPSIYLSTYFKFFRRLSSNIEINLWPPLKRWFILLFLAGCYYLLFLFLYIFPKEQIEEDYSNIINTSWVYLVIVSRFSQLRFLSKNMRSRYLDGPEQEFKSCGKVEIIND